MNQLRRWLLAALLLATAWTAPAGAQTVESIKARGVVNIGILVDVPPYGILDDKNQPAGYDIDVARLLGERMGVKTNLVVVTGPNRIPYLLSGKVDMLVAVLAIVPERTKLVAFSEPYSGFSQFIYAKKELSLKSVDDLAGLTVAVPRANTTDITLSRIAPKTTNLLRFDDDASVRQALLSGQADATTQSEITAPTMDKLAPGRFERKFDLQSQVEGVALRKNATELLAWVNDAIEAMKKSGQLQAINEKWVGGKLPDLKMPQP